ncbi:MAG: outer membrane beta-barrel protein [Planctomycetota bacterium]|jgi:hypothetical protein
MKAAAMVQVAALSVAALVFSGCPIGLTAGVGWTDFTGDGVISDGRRKGERAGGLLVLGSQKIAFMGEALYVRKGAENARLTGMATGAEVDLQYTQVSYMLRLGMGKHFSFFTGPYTAFIVDAKASGLIPGVNPSDVTGDVDDVETGWVVGLGLKLAILIIDFRYEVSTTPVFDSPGAPDIRNEAVTLNLALKF